MSNPTAPSNTIPGSTTLAAIRVKVRRLTLSPSTAQLSDVEIDEYVNTSVVYDFPETLRTFNLRTTFTFFTNPGQDVYPTDIASFGTNAAALDNPLYNFQNKYLTIHPPVYCAGRQLLYTQSQQHFYGMYPRINALASIGTQGNGVTVAYTGVVNSLAQVVPPGLTQNYALIQNNVLMSSVGVQGAGLALADVPVIDAIGNPTLIGNLYDVNSGAYAAAKATPPTVVLANNTINYLTGVFSITFPAAPGIGVAINSQTIPTQRSMPQSMLYFSNQFTIRPVPDQPYRINFEVFQRPTALLTAGQSPELEEYWQFIAYLAAKKVLEDRMDMDTLLLIMPELKNQEALCLRRTIVQLTNQRAATIYAENMQNGGSDFQSGSGFF